MTISAVLFDIGGVLLTNGWDRHQRKATFERFHLDAVAAEARHVPLRAGLDAGMLTLDDYLNRVIFNEPRSFSKQDFINAMYEVSQPFPEMLALAKKLKDSNKAIYTLNNESRELHDYRVKTYLLGEIFPVFFCSGFIGLSKPEPGIYQAALGMLALPADQTVFVDDREENIDTAKKLGMNTIHHKDAQSTAAQLASLGV